MKTTPTLEQIQIVTLPRPAPGQIIATKAFAGSGKTSTMIMLAESKPDKKFLYLVFTRANKEEARSKMPNNVTVENFHSVAYRYYPEYSNRVQRHKPSFQSLTQKLSSLHIRSAPRSIALGMRLYETWCQSSDPEITLSLLPKVQPPPSFVMAARSAASMITNSEKVLEAYEEKIKSMYREHGSEAVKVAKGMFQIHSSPNEPVTDDFYLKRFQLEKLQLNYDYVILDEAQDTNDVCEAIFLQQKKSVRILVGDSHQSIYHWRGAVDAIGKLERHAHTGDTTPIIFNLSQSFRFGPMIAKAADTFLKNYKQEKVTLHGNPTIESKVNLHSGKAVNVIKPGQTGTILFRTNREALNAAIELMKLGRKVGFLGGINKYGFPEIQDIHQLSKGVNPQQLTTATIKQFKNLSELREHSRITGDKQLERYTELALEQWEDMQKLQKNTVSEKICEILLTTAHQAKGLEWNQVVIGDDFTSPIEEADRGTLQTAGLQKGNLGQCVIRCLNHKPNPNLDKDGNTRLLRRKQLIIEEINLLYVAFTRATHIVSIPNKLAVPFGLQPLKKSDMLPEPNCK